MQQIVAAVRENDGLTLAPPLLALLGKLGVSVEPAQGLKDSVSTGPGHAPRIIARFLTRDLDQLDGENSFVSGTSP